MTDFLLLAAAVGVVLAIAYIAVRRRGRATAKRRTRISGDGGEAPPVSGDGGRSPTIPPSGTHRASADRQKHDESASDAWRVRRSPEPEDLGEKGTTSPLHSSARPDLESASCERQLTSGRAELAASSSGTASSGPGIATTKPTNHAGDLGAEELREAVDPEEPNRVPGAAAPNLHPVPGPGTAPQSVETMDRHVESGGTPSPRTRGRPTGHPPGSQGATSISEGDPPSVMEVHAPPNAPTDVTTDGHGSEVSPRKTGGRRRAARTSAGPLSPPIPPTFEPESDRRIRRVTPAEAADAPGPNQARTGTPAAPDPPHTELPATAPLPSRPPGGQSRVSYQDRRGTKRFRESVGKLASPPPATPKSPVDRAPAEARLRLSVHPLRRTAEISVMLSRPDGFPDRVELAIAGRPIIEAYDDTRYDDVDLRGVGTFLDDEFRLQSTEGFRWVRRARPVHVFTSDPAETGLVSTGAVRTGVQHTIVCRTTDVPLVRQMAEATGSPKPVELSRGDHFPSGWTLLSGYVPSRSSTMPIPDGLTPLDPGSDLTISLEAGLSIRPRVYAEGQPPRILIHPDPGRAAVTIGGQPATETSDGGWEAAGWDAPGHHLVDIVPGPTVSYQILPDPWRTRGWSSCSFHEPPPNPKPMGLAAQAQICGALVLGPEGHALAWEKHPLLIALGFRGVARALRPRTDMPVSIVFMPEPPAFVLAARGNRRKQGHVYWLGHTRPRTNASSPDLDWCRIVRLASVRRLSLENSDAEGMRAWEAARSKVRRFRRNHR